MSKVVSANVKRAEKPEFNPSKAYKWEPDDVFEITGLQLATFFHCLSKEANDPIGSSPAQKVEAFSSLIEVLKRGVEQGVIVEQEAPKEAEYLQMGDDQEFRGKVSKLFTE